MNQHYVLKKLQKTWYDAREMVIQKQREVKTVRLNTFILDFQLAPSSLLADKLAFFPEKRLFERNFEFIYHHMLLSHRSNKLVYIKLLE